MKIVKFLSVDEKELYGILDPLRPDEARVIEGNLFEEIKLTEKIVHIKSILPPIFPPNIFALGLNYREHADETGIDYPEVPVVFLKGTNTITGHGSPIILPEAGPNEVDYEAELAVVIGKKAKNVSPEDAGKYIFGYMCANDVSARDWQMLKQKQQWARGKSFDTFCPIGPYLVTKDEIENPRNLRIRLFLNDEVMQDSNTSNMLFDIFATISNLSQSITLLPGTIILTGTPEGVGFTRKPPIFLKEGDIVSVDIEKIGRLSNPVKHEDGHLK
jgi:2-keto-4-pentenoate hydratase/2-oxohepta-3-ene-1,7-dioic acid hydratase in catechol pathway